MDVELERFKDNINLVEFAATHGFSELDKRRSSRACTVLRNGSEKIGISRDKDNHWVFYNFDKESGGSVIDFVMEVNNCNLGAARRYLRSFVGRSIEYPIIEYFKNPKASSFDLRKVSIEYAKLLDIQGNNGFLLSRKISPKTITDERFSSTLFTDRYNNAIFPHKNEDGVSGFEKRNTKFWGFSEGGQRSLWFSRSRQEDRRLAFFESGLDALSYFQLKDDCKTQHFSIGGELSESQMQLIGKVIGGVSRNPLHQNIFNLFSLIEGGFCLS